MCGVAGYLCLERDPAQAELVVRAMVKALDHRGPDANGVHRDGPAVLGHTRLAIIDLRPESNQPFLSADGDVTLVFNGEIYNYKALAQDLEQSGVKLRTRSDTEVILELYRRDGLDFLQELRGMFAVGLWDRKQRRLVLARDRLGKKPLFYHLGKGGLAFASELGALLADDQIQRQVDPQALHAYLALGYVPTSHAILQGVHKLAPGTMAVFEGGQLRTHRYWHLQFTPAERPVSELIEELRHLLYESVSLRLVSDVPLGAFLSGGIDSSAVVAIMSKLGARPVRTFSIGFDDPDYSEVEYARQVAKLYETEHHEEVVRPQAAELLPVLVKAYGEPFADSVGPAVVSAGPDDPQARHRGPVRRRRRRGLRRLQPLRAREDDPDVPAAAHGPAAPGGALRGEEFSGAEERPPW